MAGKKEEIVIDVRSAVKLEQELQAHLDHGVVLMDIYSAEWGPCKALAETFRALNNDGGAKLRILSVECHSVLASLKNPEERNHQRPKNMEAIRETLPEAWQPILEERAGLAKPYFLVYKEGKRCGAIDGVNTPVIRSMIKDLRAVRQPPENFLSGNALQVWKQHLHPDESEISIDKFVRALNPMLDISEPLTSDERTVLTDALGAKDTKIVTADNFQKWVGEDYPISAAFIATLPEYYARAEKAKSDRQVEEKARTEKEAADQKKADDKKTQEAKEAESSLRATNDSDIARWSAAAGMSEEEATDTLELRQARKGLAITKPDKVAFTASLAILPASEGEQIAQEVAQVLSNAPTLSQFFIANGATVATVHNIRRAVEKRFVQASLMAPGKMACLALTSTDEEIDSFLGAKNLNILPATLNGSLATEFPSVALAAVTTAAGSADDGQETLFLTAPAANISGLDEATPGATVIIPPFVPFSTRGTKAINEGDVTVTLKGTERAIFTASSTVRPASALALTAWFAEYEVTLRDDTRVELTFKRFVFDDVLNAISEAARPSQVAEDDVYSAISHLQRALETKASLEGSPTDKFDEAVVEAPKEDEEETAQPDEEEPSAEPQ